MKYPVPFGQFKILQNFGIMIVIFISLVGTVQADQHAGIVVLATGAVSAYGADSKVRVLAKGSRIFPGDRVTTATKSLCVLKMVDDARMTIRADSEILIEEYVFEGNADDSSVLELVKGGFRALTGAIGSNNPDAYKVKSDLSVLGIRGTDFDTRICTPGRCLQIGGDAREYGQYTHVNSGGVYMAAVGSACVTGENKGVNSACLIDIVAGQAGFVGLDELSVLPVVPGFIEDDPTPYPVEDSNASSVLSSVEGCQL